MIMILFLYYRVILYIFIKDKMAETYYEYFEA
jgi:hypothetical protein